MSKYAFDAVIFDLDGVITKTELVHAAAWKTVFDDYLRISAERKNEPFKEFTHDADYLSFVDGKPRYEGVKSFLESRAITIPWGSPSDSSERETICGLGNKKNEVFRKVLLEQGVLVYSSTIELIKELKKNGIRVGVASSSKNCQTVLSRAGIEDLFETRVDGIVSVQLNLRGKPQGDIFAAAARNLGVSAARSVVVEDASSGVLAGRNAGFGLVLGIARKDNFSELFENGADIVVGDLEEINIKLIEEWFHRKPAYLFDVWRGRDVFLGEKPLVFFLDYDGTLTPIVARPELAVIDEEMREAVRCLSLKYTVAVVSGRMRQDVENLVGIDSLIYAGSHGFDIKGQGISLVQPEAEEIIPVVTSIIRFLKEKIGGISGLLIEEKQFSAAVHYRLVDEKYLLVIKGAVERVIKDHDHLKLMAGKKVFEILPDIDWDKGKAIQGIMEILKISWKDASVIYIGDDVTDEDAFRIIRTRGTGILVSDKPKESAADFRLCSVREVKKLFERITAAG